MNAKIEQPGMELMLYSNKSLVKLKRTLMSFGIIAAFLFLWEFGQKMSGFPEYIIPLPSSIWKITVAEWSSIITNTGVTMLESLGGFLIGNGVAVLLAVIFVHNKTIETAIYPFAIALRSIPIVAITPILVLMLGSGYAPKVAIAALITFFPTLVNMIEGLKSAEAQAFELMHVLNASKSQVFWKLRLPASMPYFFAAMKVAGTSCVLGAIVAEWIGSSKGLGYLLIISTYQFRSDLLYSTMLVSALVSIIIFVGFGWLEKLIVPWSNKESEHIGGEL